jgi:hypothetical protein
MRTQWDGKYQAIGDGETNKIYRFTVSGSVLRNHRIASDGAVSPSVVCPNPQCDFHEFVRLEGWH